MWLFKLIKLTRRIRILLGGYKSMEERFGLFRLPAPLLPQVLYARLIPHCYQYNYCSTTYRKQIFTVRRLTDTIHQVHLRFYKDGWVTGHYELQPEQDPLGHLQGVDLDTLDDEEITEIEKTLLVN